MEHYQKPLPSPDADTQPFWDSCKRHAMALQLCGSCGRFRYPPRPGCPYCLSEDAEWTQVSGQGSVYVSLHVHHPPNEAWKESTPYNVSMIELAEGVRMWSNVVGCEPSEVAIGDAVELVYDDVTPEVTLAKFRHAR